MLNSRHSIHAIARLGPVAALTIISLIAGLIVMQTYTVFNHTSDEPAHIAAGLELLDRGTYTYEAQHPPLARLAVAFGPWLAGIQSGRDHENSMWFEGARILFDTGARDAGSYDRVLSLARLGNLPFLLIMLVATFLWARTLLGPWPAVAAAFFVATSSPVLGHAGVATVDLAPAALGIASLPVFCTWLRRPNLLNSMILGVVTGAAIMTKFSMIPFLGGAYLSIAIIQGLTLRHQALRVPNVGAGNIVAAILCLIGVFWASYGLGLGPPTFPSDIDPMSPAIALQGEPVADAQRRFTDDLILPNFIGLMARGIGQVKGHNQTGHQSYLLGEVREHGWWYYYLINLGVKSPLPILILGVLGLGLLCRQAYRTHDWTLAAPPVAFGFILAFASFASNINIGIRHILILYPLLAIGGAAIVCWMFRSRHVAALTGAIVGLVWQLSAVAIAHPDHLANFNPAAGAAPENILLASDLDWGQDFKRLVVELEAREISSIGLVFRGTFPPRFHGLPPHNLMQPYQRQTGWVAASLWTKRRFGDGFEWLDQYQPVTRVGASLDLYFIPPDAIQTTLSALNGERQ